MKIHFNTLTSSDFYAAAHKAGVEFEKFSDKGSRSHKASVDIILSGNSGRFMNSGRYGADNVYSATWDQWGVFLAELFAKDSSVQAGVVYFNAEHFHWATGGRYGSNFPEHKNHKWSYEGEVVTGAYIIHRCTKCSAIRRYATKQYVKENFLDSVNA